MDGMPGINGEVGLPGPPGFPGSNAHFCPCPDELRKMVQPKAAIDSNTVRRHDDRPVPPEIGVPEKLTHRTNRFPAQEDKNEAPKEAPSKLISSKSDAIQRSSPTANFKPQSSQSTQKEFDSPLKITSAKISTTRQTVTPKITTAEASTSKTFTNAEISTKRQTSTSKAPKTSKTVATTNSTTIAKSTSTIQVSTTVTEKTIPTSPTTTTLNYFLTTPRPTVRVRYVTKRPRRLWRNGQWVDPRQ